MKKFIIKCSVFFVLIILSIYFILTLADGYTDALYLRLTTPRKNSLIIGTSLAAQGILPSILNRTLSRNDIYNFSFTLGDSPYGPSYLNAIKKKLNPGVTNGIYIVVIDPISLYSLCSNPNDTMMFEELSRCLAKIDNINTKPNFSYFLNSFNGPYFNLIKKDKRMFVHDDGWLEVNVDMDSAFIEKRIERKLLFYKETLAKNCYSQVRHDYLIKTILFLKQHGQVFLVRLPVHPKMTELVNKSFPDFNAKIEDAIKISNGYFDMSLLNSSYIYPDGNHLFKESGKVVTQKIANWIIEQNKHLH